MKGCEKGGILSIRKRKIPESGAITGFYFFDRAKKNYELNFFCRFACEYCMKDKNRALDGNYRYMLLVILYENYIFCNNFYELFKGKRLTWRPDMIKTIGKTFKNRFSGSTINKSWFV